MTRRDDGHPSAPHHTNTKQVESFERTFDENEELGLNDMNTDDFETLPEGYVHPTVKQGGGGEVSHLIPHRVGTDHPTAFTKGQEEADDTVTDGGGAVKEA